MRRLAACLLLVAAAGGLAAVDLTPYAPQPTTKEYPDESYTYPGVDPHTNPTPPSVGIGVGPLVPEFDPWLYIHNLPDPLNPQFFPDPVPEPMPPAVLVKPKKLFWIPFTAPTP